MWNCPNCDEPLEESFAICWQCGTDRQGKVNPNFVPVNDGDLTIDSESSKRNGPPQFSLRFLFLFSTAIGAILGLVNAPGSVSFIFWAIIGANLLGLIIGLFVTHILQFPNDGSLTWREQNDEEISE